LLATLASEQPDRQTHLMTAVSVQISLAKTLEKLGRYGKAGQVIELAMAQHTKLAAADPQNIGNNPQMLTAIATAVRIAYRQGDLIKTIGYGREGLARHAALSEELQIIMDVRNDLAEIKEFLGLALMAGSKPGMLPRQPLATLKEACTLLTDSVAFMDEILTTMPDVGDKTDILERRTDLANCQALLARLGAR